MLGLNSKIASAVGSSVAAVTVGGAPKRARAATTKAATTKAATTKAATTKAAGGRKSAAKAAGAKAKAKGKGRAAVAPAKRGGRRPQRGGGDCGGPPIEVVQTGDRANIALTLPRGSDSPDVPTCAMKSPVPFAETGLLPERVDQTVFGGTTGPFNLPVLQSGGRRGSARCRQCGARL